MDDHGGDQTQVPLYSLADVQLRFLCPTDFDEVRALCQDWFPIEYPISWYEEITSSTRYARKQLKVACLFVYENGGMTLTRKTLTRKDLRLTV